MTYTTEEVRAARRARHEAILAEVTQEEAEAAEAEIAEKASTLDMPLHLRIDRELDASCAGGLPPSTSPPPRWSGACSGGSYTSTAPPGSPRPTSRTSPAASPGKNSIAADRNAQRRSVSTSEEYRAMDELARG